MFKKAGINTIDKIGREGKNLESHIALMEEVIDRIIELLVSGELEIKTKVEAEIRGVVGGEDEGRVV